MRFCRFGVGSYGLIDGEDVFEVSEQVGSDPTHGDPLVLALPKLMARPVRGVRRKLAGMALLSPVRWPRRIFGATNTYRERVAERAGVAAGAGDGGMMADAGLFLKATSSLIGPGEGISQRFLERRTDFEVEFVAVIGDPVMQPIGKDEALAHVAGYSVGLDITLRGDEDRSLRKSIDSYAVLGPCLVTRDEVPDVGALTMSLRVNGRLRQTTQLSEMAFDVADQISEASRYCTLKPGDLFFTGTPAGVGPIRPGDLIHVNCTTIGMMEVAVRAAA